MILAFVAQISLTSIFLVFVLPTRVISLRSSAMRSFACEASDKLPISSRNSVPPDATSIRPALGAVAPVNAPFSYPNSSLSNSCSGTLPKSIGIKGYSFLFDKTLIIRATTSLPVPFSPSINTLASVSATRSIMFLTFSIAGESPIRLGIFSPNDWLSIAIFSLSDLISRLEWRSSAADFIVASIFSFSHGLEMKSVAPALIARTTFSVSE